MAVRLAWGLTADRDRCAWRVESGEPVDPWARDLPDGAAVVLGAAGSDASAIGRARAELAALIEAGGLVIAGAGVDLGDGFVSARLAGATGDRRDGVLAGLRVLGLDGASRLGERAATLVALFGIAATKPVGAATETAIREGRWAALRLASAAAEVMEPEQLEQILALRAPEGVDPMPSGAPSAIAVNLRRVLEPYPRRRRLALLIDLWDQVCARHTAAQSRARLMAGQDLGIVDELRKRYQHVDEELIGRAVSDNTGRAPTIASAVRFIPTWDNFWRDGVVKAVKDAVAATVLLRAAIAVHEHGVVDGLALVRDQIAAASSMVSRDEVKQARRRVPDQIALPARPICVIREIDNWLAYQRPLNAQFERVLRKRLATALAYALTVDDACHDLLCNDLPYDSLPDAWDLEELQTYRKVVGYTDVRAPAEWRQSPAIKENAAESLGERLDADPSATEQASDLLWYGDLADAMLQLRGHEAARIRYDHKVIHFDTELPLPEPEPLTPRLDSIPLAVAGAAQLISLGAAAPARCRNWAELSGGLMTSGAVADALSSEFEVPEPILDEDGRVLPGSEARIQIARNAGRLAEWSDYMGNCIAGEWYQDDACKGLSILIALRDRQDTILVNAELRATGAGWRVNEIRGRFNNDPDPELDKAFRAWTRTLRSTEPEPDPITIEPPQPTSTRRPAANPVREIGPELARVTRRTLADSDDALAVLAAIAGHDDADPKTLTALRRANPDRLARLCADALDARRVPLPRLWAATSTRPLAAAVAALNPATLSRYPRLRRLSDDAPLPSKSLRALVKDPDLATARSMDLVALRLRAALWRLAREDGPILARAIQRDATTDVLCPLILAITCAAPDSTTAITTPDSDTVPGFPTSSLTDSDGPWHRAWPAATEFGATPERFRSQLTITGALIPTAWLPSGGWPSLWSRAAARTGGNTYSSERRAVPNEGSNHRRSE